MKRRAFIRAVPLPVLGIASHHMAWARNKPTYLRIVNSGGTTADTLVEAYGRPFTERTGIEIRSEAPGNLGKLRAMIAARNITADIFELSSSNLSRSLVNGYIQPLDWNAIDPEKMFPEAKKDSALGYQYFSTVMMWRSDEAAPLTNWVDFFDIKRFPGPRCLSGLPHYCLQFALLADGVAKDDLFPLDVDRAIRKLETIKDHVVAWWQSGAQPIQMLESREARYSVGWSSSLALNPAISGTFQDGMFDISYLTIPTGVDADTLPWIYQYLHEVTKLSNQLNAVKILPLGGSHPDIAEHLTAADLEKWPTSPSHKKLQFQQNSQWWADNHEAVEKLWQQFLLSA